MADPLPSPPRWAVVGCGAVGCYYGGLLHLAGEEVHFLMRSDLAAARQRGLTLRLPSGEQRLHPIRASGQPSEIGPVDIVLVAAKSTANADLPALIAPLLHPGSVIVTLQNGLGNEEGLAAHFGASRILGMLCFVCLNRTAPAVVENYHPGLVALGEFAGPLLSRTREIAARLERAGVKVRLSASLAEARWRKLVWNVPFNGLSIAAGGITTDRIMADPKLVTLAQGLMDEIIRTAARQGLAIPLSFREQQLEVTREMGAYRPSSLIDFLAGREVEVEAIWGEPLRRALALGEPVPRLETLYALIAAQVAARRP